MLGGLAVLAMLARLVRLAVIGGSSIRDARSSSLAETYNLQLLSV